MFKKIRKILILNLFAVLLLQNASFGLNEQQAVQKKHEAAQKKVQKLRLLERIETNKLYKNQQRLEQNEQNLDINEKKHVAAQQDLISLQAQLREATADYEGYKGNTNRRIVQIYKKQRTGYIRFLLSARDINNFLDRLYYENLIIKEDKTRIANAQIKTRRISNLKQKIENQEKMLQKNIDTMKKERKNIENTIDQNKRYIEKLQTDRKTWEKAERELAKESERLTTLINRSTKDSSDVPVVTAGFMRPVNSYRLTSPYGWRVHPIFKQKKFHSGIDMACPSGTPIKVANNGKVIYAGWYGGYGKVVIVDHGKINGHPTTTLYAHMSSIKAAVGQSVTRGQVIGNVGSTGYSTGPHLHFEVRVNGKTQNPFNYISK